MALGYTAITDQGADTLARINGLESLSLHNTAVYDLRPFRAHPGLTGIGLTSGLSFRNTTATKEEPRLAEIAAMRDGEARMQALTVFLETWVPDRKVLARWRGAPAVSAPPTLTTPRHVTQAKLQSLILFAPAPPLTATQLADQIAAALAQVPCEDGKNSLPEEFALFEALRDHLRFLAQDMIRPNDATIAARIAHLEATVEKLAAELVKETKRADLAEMKLAKEGFVQPFKTSVGTGLGYLAVGARGVSAGMTATYYLGEAHPVTKALLEVISSAAK